MRHWWSLALVVACACTRSNPDYCDAETPCSVGSCNLGENSCSDGDIGPSNGLGDDLDFIDENPGAIDDLVLSTGATVNSDGDVFDGSAPIAVPSRLAPQAGGDDIRVYRVRSLRIEGTANFFGDLPIAFVAADSISVGGRVVVASGQTSGSCDGEEKSGEGGGGGGFSTDGARGADVDGDPGGDGGNAFGTDNLVPLVGGCGGGGGAKGGGALQLVTRGTVTLTSVIDAGGAGGGQRLPNPGGGGSGGGILIEAGRVLAPSGALVANGGGGGCAQAPGARGGMTSVPAPGGVCSSGHGNGGAGAAGATAPGEGISGTATGGGGGGSVGRVRINAGEVNIGLTSPAASLGPLGSR